MDKHKERLIGELSKISLGSTRIGSADVGRKFDSWVNGLRKNYVHFELKEYLKNTVIKTTSDKEYKEYLKELIK